MRRFGQKRFDDSLLIMPLVIPVRGLIGISNFVKKKFKWKNRKLEILLGFKKQLWEQGRNVFNINFRRFLVSSHVSVAESLRIMDWKFIAEDWKDFWIQKA
jgi:hypothetical protein